MSSRIGRPTARVVRYGENALPGFSPTTNPATREKYATTCRAPQNRPAPPHGRTLSGLPKRGML